MTGQMILDNSFFAFWHTFGEYFIILLALALLGSIVIGFIHILTKK